MSSGDWKGEVLTIEDAWPGLEEEEEDVEVYNLTHQSVPGPRKWSTGSANGSTPRPRRSLPAISIGFRSQAADRTATEDEGRRHSCSVASTTPSLHRSTRSASSLYADLVQHLRPRSTSPRPRSPSTGDVQGSSPRSRGSTRLSAGQARPRSKSYDAAHIRIEVPCDTLVDLG